MTRARTTPTPAAVRLGIDLGGQVQGIGLRPWVAQRARALGLAGSVRNTRRGVRVVLEGSADAIASWRAGLRESAPEGLRIERWQEDAFAARGARGFRILESDSAGLAGGRIPADAPLCDGCRDELFDPANRRYRYPFLHCAGCGPRASVLERLPYDRSHTSLAAFPPCDACRREYADPQDRRFHAQTIACSACGPRLAAGPPGSPPEEDDPIEQGAAALAQGACVAVKGYGGFHLMADACSPRAVARLRERKGRPTRPLALLIPDLEAARAIVELDPHAEALLAGPAHAVVIAPRRDAGCAALGLAPGVAATRDLGVVLPCAPIHWLLAFAPGSRPGRDAPRLPALVFTSANPSGEPTLWQDHTARQSLAGIADLVIGHDRAVRDPCDDPVYRAAPSGPVPIRLSRGTPPNGLPAPNGARSAPSGIAVGGDLKCAPALFENGEICPLPHVGDLASEAREDLLGRRLERACRQRDTRPRWVAHDLHPDYAGTRLAERLGPPCIAVQHHHAHAMACLVDHAVSEPALALVLDGAGFGPDGSVWGGELLRVDGATFERRAHLETVRLAGGDRAAREPWRMAAIWLERAFPAASAPTLPWHARRDREAHRTLLRAAARGVNAPPTSSCGRLFDAVASILDCGDLCHHEGEAALALESLASTVPSPARRGEGDRAPSTTATGEACEVVPARDLVRAVVLARLRREPRGQIARDFHAALARRLGDTVARHARATGLGRIALSGGCFQNRLLGSDLDARLRAEGLEPLWPRRVPPSDAGLAVGQAAVAGLRVAGLAGPSANRAERPGLRRD